MQVSKIAVHHYNEPNNFVLQSYKNNESYYRSI